MTAMTRRALRALAAVLSVTAMLVGWWPMSAHAEAPDAVGWWSKTKPVTTPPELGNPVPPPPDAPNEGFIIANDPTGGVEGQHSQFGCPWPTCGPQAVAAMRFEATRPRKATLTIRTPTGETLGPGVELAACPVLGPWDQAIDGAWDARPEADCDTVASPGVINEARTAVSFAINEEYFRLGILVNTIEVYILPRPNSVSPFRESFSRPDVNTLVADGPLLEAPTLESVFEPPAEPGDVPTPVTFAPLPTDGGFDNDVFEPVTPTNTDGQVAVDDPIFRSTGPGLVVGSGGSGDRWLAVALLALLAAGLFVISGQSVPQPRLLGGLASAGTVDAGAPASDSGMGRFRRPRAGAPPTMR